MISTPCLSSSKAWRGFTVGAATLLIGVVSLHGASAYTLKTLYSFCRLVNCVDGTYPEGALLQDATTGNLFGTATGGGAYNSGVVFELTKAKADKWKYHVLYSFCAGGGVCTDGLTPYSELIEDKNGNLYGTTYYGGAYGKGAVFELLRNGTQWIETVLYSFCAGGGGCTDGKSPWTGLTYAGQSSGVLYNGSSPLFGATYEGGHAGRGVAYQLQLNGSTWSEQVIHAFDPASAPGPLILDDSGNLYGVTYSGGLNGEGRLYRLDADRDWHQVVLYDFCALSSCLDGSDPLGRPFMDAHGNLFGTTVNGGVAQGVAYRLSSKGGGWQYTKLYDFCSEDNCRDGRYPVGGLQMDASGDLYGTTHAGGKLDGGTVFKLHHGKKWSEEVLYRFCAKTACKDGTVPRAPVILDRHGNLFGTTYQGGANGDYGTVFELTP